MISLFSYASVEIGMMLHKLIVCGQDNKEGSSALAVPRVGFPKGEQGAKDAEKYAIWPEVLVVL